MTSLRLILSTSLTTTFGTMAPFLVGALAFVLQPELGITPHHVGVAIALFFLSGAIVAIPLGAGVDRLQIRRSVRLASISTSAVLMLFAVGMRSFVLLCALMVLAGIANGAVQPAANRALSYGIAPSMYGVAVGIKQAAVPFATLLAGASIPVVALRWGWRTSFMVLSAAALVPLILAPKIVERRPIRGGASNRRRSSTKAWLLFAVVSGCGTAFGVSLGSFLTTTGVAADLSPLHASWLLTAGAALSIACRLALGRFVDRSPQVNPLRLAALVVSCGIIGPVLMMSSRGQVGFAVGALVAMGLGWGWPGLLHYSVVRYFQSDAGQATGVVLLGVSVGGILGPLATGAAVGTGRYTSAALVLIVLMMLAVVALFIAGGQLFHEQTERS